MEALSSWRRYRLTFILALAFSAENADLGVLRQGLHQQRPTLLCAAPYSSMQALQQSNCLRFFQLHVRTNRALAPGHRSPARHAHNVARTHTGMPRPYLAI